MKSGQTFPRKLWGRIVHLPDKTVLGKELTQNCLLLLCDVANPQCRTKVLEKWNGLLYIYRGLTLIYSASMWPSIRIYQWCIIYLYATHFKTNFLKITFGSIWDFANRFPKPEEQIKWMKNEGAQVIANDSLSRIYFFLEDFRVQWLIFATCKRQRVWREILDYLGMNRRYIISNAMAIHLAENSEEQKLRYIFIGHFWCSSFRYLHPAFGKFPLTFGFFCSIYTRQWVLLDITSNRLHLPLSLPLILDDAIFSRNSPISTNCKIPETWNLRLHGRTNFPDALKTQ